MIGPYRIERELGRGGMGVVYLAHDTRLDRTVALKVLPEEVSRDPERLSRFEREAKLLASLNHTNIGAIYDVVESEGRRYLALEHIEGETLAQRLAGGALPTAESREICLQIATGLETAHERGVIHRDLKPGNVMVTRDDQVKIVDFGLAKGSVAPDFTTTDSPTLPASSPTITSPALSPGTMTGVILGTAPYLSPEQARGKAVDRRTDIWSFGCILYECLTGKMAFHGETVSDTVAAILKQEPDWAALPRDVPPRVRELLRRCLEKDPRQRLRDIGEARLLFEGIRGGGSQAFSETNTSRRGNRFIRLGVPPMALVLSAAVGYWLAVHSAANDPVKSAPPVEASILLPRAMELDAPNGSIALSPDGRQIVLEGNLENQPSQLWLRPVGASDVRAIPGTSSATYPFWSPNSRTIGFFADQKLKRVSLDGGPVQVICDALDGRGATWSQNGTIVFAPAPVGGLCRVPASGGKATPLTDVKAPGTHRLPRFLPDGRHLLYFCDSPAMRGICTLDLRSKRSALLLESSSDGLPVEPGYLFSLRDGNLLAQRLNLRTLRLEGEAIPVAANVPLSPNRHTGPYSASGGTLVYGHTDLWPLARLTRFDWRGQVIDSIGEPNRYGTAQLSPDGSRVGAVVQSGLGFGFKVFDLTRRGDSGRLFPDFGYFFAWSPDGREVVHSTSGVRQVDVRAEGMSIASVFNPSQRRVIHVDGPAFPTAWSPDGQFVLYHRQSAATREDIWICPLREPGKAHALLAAAASERANGFSPDGKWLLYGSDESGRFELYITPFPGLDSKWPVSTQGSLGGEWLRDGRIVYITPQEQLVGVRVSFANGQPTFGPPVSMFGGRRFQQGGGITPDGMRFVAAIRSETEAPSLTIVTNWQGLVRGK